MSFPSYIPQKYHLKSTDKLSSKLIDFNQIPKAGHQIDRHVQEMEDVVKALLQLEHLEKIVWERWSGSSHTLSSTWAPLKDKIHMWTAEESRAYAQSMIKDGFSRAGEQLPISPRWTYVSPCPLVVSYNIFILSTKYEVADDESHN